MEYDNTDRGAAFPPRNTQKLILQGNGQFGSKEVKLVFVSDTSKNGKDFIEVYQKIGCVFENTFKDPSDKKPHFTGKLEAPVKEIACWRMNKAETNLDYMQWKIKESFAKDDDDDIPFGKDLDRMAEEVEEERQQKGGKTSGW